jgi:chromosomal replication initiator protein DnaA
LRQSSALKEYAFIFIYLICLLGRLCAVMNAKQIWQSALERIQTQVSQATFNTWFSGTSARALQGHLLTVRVKTTFDSAHLENRFYDLICSVLREFLGADAEVRFEIGEPEEPGEAALHGNMALSAILLAPQEASTSSEAPSSSLEEVDEQEAPQPLRGATLMTVAAARRDRLEVAQPGRRLGRRPLSYTGPKLLPVAGPVVAAPLLTRLYPVDEHEGHESTPTWQEEPQNGNHHPTTVALEPTMPLLLTSTGDHRGEDRLNGTPTSGMARTPSAPAHSSSFGSSGSNNGASAIDGVFNASYTFSTFIVGKSNELAHAAAQAVADAPGHEYNPLVFHSGVGLGKTHLLHAIAHRGIAAGLKVLYTTSDRFTNEIINAIRFHTTEEFRAKYRQIDILLVDDIQFIAGKESTEEEFFHTFNALHNANKHIVLTTDRPPKAMVTLQDRLRSRFEWGLIADIQPPDLELRIAILRSKSEGLYRNNGEPLIIPDDVIHYLAGPPCESVRELEGALTRLVAYARVYPGPLTVNIAMQVLGQLHTDSRKRTLEPAQVLDLVMRHFHVSLEMLCGAQRDRSIVWPRQVAMFLMREETQAKLEQIGDELHRDHSTVMHGLKRVEARIALSDRVRKEIAALREELHALNQPEG